MEFDITGTYMKKDGIGIWHLTQVIKWVKEDTTSNLYGRKIPFCLGKLIVLITFKSLSDYPYITLDFFARHFRKRSTHKCGISSIKIKFSCWLGFLAEAGQIIGWHTCALGIGIPFWEILDSPLNRSTVELSMIQYHWNVLSSPIF